MRVVPITLFCVCLAGCNTPPSGFRGLPPTTVAVGKSTFDVRYVNNRALALRTNAESAIGNHGITGRGIIAIQKVSGCQVVPGSVEGDTILIYADINC